jgi:hypothetical protein
MHLVNILRIITFSFLVGHSILTISDFNSFRVFWDTLYSMFRFPCNPNGGDWRMWFRLAIFIWRVCGHFSSLRFKKSMIEKLNNCSFVLCKNWIVYWGWATLWRRDSLLNFHSVFLDTMYNLWSVNCRNQNVLFAYYLRIIIVLYIILIYYAIFLKYMPGITVHTEETAGCKHNVKGQ